MYHGTSFHAALSSKTPLLHIASWAACVTFLHHYCGTGGHNACHAMEDAVPETIQTAMTWLVTFTFSTYLGTVLARFHERFNHCCQTNAHMTQVTLLSAALLADQRRAAATLMRWTLLMMHLYYVRLRRIKPPDAQGSPQICSALAPPYTSPESLRTRGCRTFWISLTSTRRSTSASGESCAAAAS